MAESIHAKVAKQRQDVDTSAPQKLGGRGYDDAASARTPSKSSRPPVDPETQLGWIWSPRGNRPLVQEKDSS